MILGNVAGNPHRSMIRGHSNFKCYVGVVSFPRKKRYEGVRFNVISVMRVGVKCPGKKRYVTLEWPLTLALGVSSFRLQLKYFYTVVRPY